MRRFQLILRLASFAGFLATAASAQQEATFHGSPVRSFYDRGIIAAPVTTSDGHESLRIVGSYEEVVRLIEGAPPAAESLRRGHFQWRIGPDPLGPRGRCQWASLEISDLEKCFIGRPILSTHVQIETVEIVLPDDLKEFRQFLSRHKTAKSLYATCGMHGPSGTKLSCDVVFEQAGLRHVASARWPILEQLLQYRCLVLAARTVIWPDGPSIADTCS